MVSRIVRGGGSFWSLVSRNIWGHDERMWDFSLEPPLSSLVQILQILFGHDCALAFELQDVAEIVTEFHIQ